MANSDNPIQRTIDTILGLSSKPKSFSEKVTLLQQLTGDTGDTYATALLKHGSLFDLVGATRSSQMTYGSQSLAERLFHQGLVPESASTLFGRIEQQGGELFFNQSNKTLFFLREGKVTSLPLQSSKNLVTLGGLERKVNSLLGDQGPTTFVNAFYKAAAGIEGPVEKTVKEALATRVGSTRLQRLLMESTSTRGRLTPEEGFFTYNRLVLPGNAEFSGILARKQAAEKAYAMLVKTGGRVIDKEFRNLTGAGSFRQAFGFINQMRSQYLAGLTSYLEQNNLLSTFPYVKPEFLGGDKSKILGAGRRFANDFGTLFEEHSLKKGLFQLAKLAATTPEQASRVASMGINPYTPFVTSLSNNLHGMQNLRIAVADFDSELAMKVGLGEGGAFLTTRGAERLRSSLPMGTVSIRDPSKYTISTAEKLFGFNLGEGNTLLLNNKVTLTRQQFARAANRKEYRYGHLSHTERRLRDFISSNPENRGLIEQIIDSQGTLTKVKLSHGGLKLEFSSDQMPGTLELVSGARRFTSRQESVLRRSIPSKLLHNVDLVIPSDEFAKTYGPQVYVHNFIGKVQEQHDALSLLSDTFKSGFSLGTTQEGKQFMVPVVQDADTAFKESLAMVEKWKRSGDRRLMRLAKEIEQGTKLLKNGVRIPGIKSLRAFYMGTAVRTDFMGDINIMKPVRVTTSKMLTLATGARAMGYNDAYSDPIFNFLIGRNQQWKSGLISINRHTNELELSNEHTAKRFARALQGFASPEAHEIVTLGPEGFLNHEGKKFSMLPEMESLRTMNGGVPLSYMRDTVLGANQEIAFLDLGGPTKLSLLGKEFGEQTYRYLPIPIRYLRTQQGALGNLTIDSTNPAFEFLKALSSLERDRGFSSSINHEVLGPGLLNIAKSLAGKSGLLNRSSAIVMHAAGRVRLSPYSTRYHASGNLDRLYDIVMTRGDFNAFVDRKYGLRPKGFEALRKQAEKTDTLYGIMNFDPMQRAEHMRAVRVKLIHGKRTGKFGQLNAELDPYHLRQGERDLDRDVGNLIFTDAYDSSVARELEDRIQRQIAEEAPYVGYYRFMSSRTPMPSAKKRFSNIAQRIVTNVSDYLGTYLGIRKSAGYTLVRSSDQIINTIVGQGIEGARNLGLFESSKITAQIVNKIREPLVADMERYSVAQSLLQNLYQGAVQKGSEGKAALHQLGETLTEIGQRYQGHKFDYEAVVGESQKAIREVLEHADKDRVFGALNYFFKSGTFNEETTNLLKEDLARATTEVLTGASADRVLAARGAMLDASSRLMAEILGPGMVLTSSVKRAPKLAKTVIQAVMKGRRDPADIVRTIIDPLAGGKVGDLPIPEDATKEVVSGAKTAAEASAEAIKGKVGSSFGKVKEFFTHNGKFWGGVAVGALGASLFMSLRGRPEPPLPREVDSRQPSDPGPVVYRKPPTIYGSKTNFNKRPHSNQTFTSVSPYRLNVNSTSRISVEDDTSSINPYAIQRQMKQIASSDYSY